MLRYYPNRRLIAERLLHGIRSGRKFIFISPMTKGDGKRTYFRKMPFNKETENYLLSDYYLVTNSRLRDIIDIIREFAFSIGSNGFKDTLYGVVDYDEDLQAKINILNKVLG